MPLCLHASRAFYFLVFRNRVDTVLYRFCRALHHVRSPVPLLFRDLLEHQVWSDSVSESLYTLVPSFATIMAGLNDQEIEHIVEDWARPFQYQGPLFKTPAYQAAIQLREVAQDAFLHEKRVNVSGCLKIGDGMATFYERYLQGEHQEVYEELLLLGEQLLVGSSLYQEAQAIMREMMRRVRVNLEEILIPRLQTIGYRFGDGSFDFSDNLSATELEYVQQAHPIFQPPTEHTPRLLKELEQLVGNLPLSLTCWYEQVGAVNLIGAFPDHLIRQRDERFIESKKGYGLDPISIDPLEMIFTTIQGHRADGVWDDWLEDSSLPLAPDGDFKYGYSGGGYEMSVPCHMIDEELLGFRGHLTFVNYLRTCIQSGGFPGLGFHITLHHETMSFLTRDLLPF